MNRKFFTVRNSSQLAAVAGALLLAGALALASPAFARSAGGTSATFITVKSNQDYSATVNALTHSVKNNGLMVMGKVNQKGILAMTGLHLAGAESFLVGNPRIGKKLFKADPAVAAVVPARISVWVRHGTTYVGYFKPSAQLTALSRKLSKPGHMLNAKFRKIVKEATQ